jgi:hypothetical protein
MTRIGTVDHCLDILLGPGNEGNTSAFGVDAEGFGKDTGYAVSGMAGIGDEHGSVGVFVKFMEQGMDEGGLPRSRRTAEGEAFAGMQQPFDSFFMLIVPIRQKEMPLSIGVGKGVVFPAEEIAHGQFPGNFTKT